ncbi:T9SS type A sorting domain-containing protein [Pedobacter metabolipauper]|uniref:Putative secreted protein (Por secretion system target) n=1 Tax=Pedobacter metabolipauper TaxID=425513 RepID=A0A4V3D0T4_9SPHI|nr:T9SS type A sorting domain-containing protein [Pedobacter metabolipauper]TDQ07399.1 putative secreted protein (Por secretion system target) [Pedobacter metabolipauper]
MSVKLPKVFLLRFFCILCLGVFSVMQVFAQKPDSSISSIRSKKINKTPQIKASVPTYRPKYNNGFIQYNDVIANTKLSTPVSIKPEKILTVLKVYPNPVDNQINVIVRLERESNFSVKIMDLLGNEVLTLSNERIAAGEQTKNYNIPNRLNAGIYFLKIVAASETVVKRISVL